MNYAKRGPLLDDLEQGNIKANAYASEISEADNDKCLSELESRAQLIKQLTRDIHSEVESQNNFLDGMGFEMDGARKMLSSTVEHLTRVFDSKANRNLGKIVICGIGFLAVLYYLTKR